IKPHSQRVFTLANGATTARPVGDALFTYQGHQAASPVIFGQPKDSHLLGTVTLESLGFILDPLQRELRQLPMNLVAFR
ncbi:MAG: aspartyl protease, partial [Candidatus Andersenbacteria bacterium]|nr:aspartyl protease [Candidatus Andersenbacteria bacterium]